MERGKSRKIKSLLKRSYIKIEDLRSTIETLRQENVEPIATIRAACKSP